MLYFYILLCFYSEQETGIFANFYVKNIIMQIYKDSCNKLQ